MTKPARSLGRSAHVQHGAAIAHACAARPAGSRDASALLAAFGDRVSEPLGTGSQSGFEPGLRGAATSASGFLFPWAGGDNETVSENAKGPRLTFHSPYSGILNCDVN